MTSAVLVLLLAPGCDFSDEAALSESEPVQCSSSPNDPADLGLRRTRLRLVRDGIEVTWTTSKPDTDVSYWVELTDQYGAAYRELDLFFWSGDLATALGSEFSASVHDLPTDADESVDRAPEIAGNSVTMVFPRSAIEREGEVLHWRAAIGAAVDGEDRDDWCPDPLPGDTTPEPRELPQATPGA